MNLEEIIRKRKSVRSFQNKDIPDLEEMIALARMGPSAGAIRGYTVIITKEKVGPYNAPVYVVICVNQEAYVHRYGSRGYDLYSIQDAAIFGAYLQLLLVDRGLASVWVGAFNEGRVKRIIGTELRPVAIIAVGYEVA